MARAANPVGNVNTTGIVQIQELDTRAALNDVSRRGLVAVAAVMPKAQGVEFLVGFSSCHDFARVQIVDLRNPRLLSPS